MAGIALSSGSQAQSHFSTLAVDETCLRLLSPVQAQAATAASNEGSVRTETTREGSRLCNASKTSLGIGLGSHQAGEERIPALMEQPSLFPQWDSFPHGRAAAEVLALFIKCGTEACC